MRKMKPTSLWLRQQIITDDLKEKFYCSLSAASLVWIIRDCVGDKLSFDEKYEIALAIREDIKDLSDIFERSGP